MAHTSLPGPHATRPLAARPASDTGTTPQNQQLSVSAVCARAVLAGGFAILAAVAITMLLRGMTNMMAFESTTTLDDGVANLGALCAGVFTATLLAALVLYALQKRTPRAFEAFLAILGLSYVAYLLVTVLGGLSGSQRAGNLVAALLFAGVIAVLAGWATNTLPKPD
ncbi:Protein of unknown function [Streptacidiphilus jiangxiensis]|uniref:Uncharacterized protein n=1 Tax=Streptacidiphilus jiangxiensis TaxID=235985 RepID=A0A1H7P5Y2_STRJI|nr:Protein of unknown function [Streptacidiphilus jiangxiensis]